MGWTKEPKNSGAEAKSFGLVVARVPILLIETRGEISWIIYPELATRFGEGGKDHIVILILYRQFSTTVGLHHAKLAKPKDMTQIIDWRAG